MALLSIISAVLLATTASALPIINGTTTSEYRPVGAIGVLAGGSVYGPFCSATLIDPSWVLTAGHCVDALNGHYSGYTGVFMVGDDFTRPDGMETYATITEAFSHPSYSSSNLAYDIGLLHLSSPLTTVGIMPINRDTIGQTWIGEDLRYVGFGVTDRYGGNQGAGIKRYADIPVWEYDRSYVYGYDPDDGQNVCSGDSGGAALEIVVDGEEYELVAVNSTVFAPYGGESCRDGATAGVRVDMNLPWIEQYADVVTAEEYYQEDPVDPEDTDAPWQDTAWELPDRPGDKAVDDWGCGCASGRAGLGGLLWAALGLVGLGLRRRA